MATILRKKAVLARTGYTNTPLYGDIAKGLFTEAVKINGRRAAGWPDYEVDQLVAVRIASKTDDEIRALVAKLHAARKAVR